MFVKVSEGCRPELLNNCPLNDITTKCWDESPLKRPLFEEIEGMLMKKAFRISLHLTLLV